MRTFTFPMAALIGVTVLLGSATAFSDTGPRYIGARSADPEKETYGHVMTAGTQRLLGFIGPARLLGAATGDMEKDTIAYRPLLVSTSPSPETTLAQKQAGQ